MPYNAVQVSQANVDSLKPKATFSPSTRFGERIAIQQDAKASVASYIANRYADPEQSAFVTDGSSTFYVCLAIAHKCCQSGHGFTLKTNNLAISTELDAWDAYPRPLSLELLGGHKTNDLNATLTLTAHAKKLVQGCIIIASARELFFDKGPTSPDDLSKVFKERALTTNNLKIIAVDWQKLSAVTPSPAGLVFPGPGDWDALLTTGDMVIVCDRPPNTDTVAVGQDVATRLAHAIHRPTMWAGLKPEERYSWTAHRFGGLQNVEFVEVEITP